MYIIYSICTSITSASAITSTSTSISTSGAGATVSSTFIVLVVELVVVVSHYYKRTISTSSSASTGASTIFQELRFHKKPGSAAPTPFLYTSRNRDLLRRSPSRMGREFGIFVHRLGIILRLGPRVDSAAPT